MSRQDAQLLTEMWEQMTAEAPLSREDFSRFAERWWDPGITYEEDPRWPGSGTYAGRETVREVFEGYRDVLGEPTMTVERVVEADEDTVVLVRLGGTSPGSDVPWDHLWAYVCRLRDGKLSYLRAYWDPDEALAAAGSDSS